MTPTSSGSKNGLVVWSVIATILGLGGIIWGFVSFAQSNKATQDLEALQKSYTEVVDRPGLSGPNVTALREIAADTNRGFAGMKLVDIAVQQKNDMATLAAGTTDDVKARADAEAAITAAKAAAGEKAAVASDSLVATVRSLTDFINTQKASIAALNNDLAAAREAEKAALEQKAVVSGIADEKVALATNEVAEIQKAADSYSVAQDAQRGDVEQQLVAKNEELLTTQQQLNERILQLQQEKASIGGQLEQANAERAKYRVPTNQILTAADGQITRTLGTDRVFINLGRGDQIAAGMTFEVYDRAGVPNVSKDDPADDQLLKGKASIEVIAPQQGISECRVVRLSPGATITEGDPILNVVYDRNVKFNFYVFGQFNLDYAGEANDRDGEIVKRLISGWGANVADQIDTKTDFVILGEEPVVPAYTQEELASEPEKAFQKEQAEQALDTYTEVRNRANALNIPILNQTRFLYLIGYYDEAAR